MQQQKGRQHSVETAGFNDETQFSLETKNKIGGLNMPQQVRASLPQQHVKINLKELQRSQFAPSQKRPKSRPTSQMGRQPPLTQNTTHSHQNLITLGDGKANVQAQSHAHIGGVNNFLNPSASLPTFNTVGRQPLADHRNVLSNESIQQVQSVNSSTNGPLQINDLQSELSPLLE